MKADMLDLSTQIEHAVNGVAGHSPHSATDNATIVVDRDQLRRACRGLAIQGATLMTMVATDDDTAITLRYIFALPMGLGRPSHIVTIEVAVPTDDLTYPSATLEFARRSLV